MRAQTARSVQGDSGSRPGVNLGVPILLFCRRRLDNIVSIFSAGHRQRIGFFGDPPAARVAGEDGGRRGSQNLEGRRGRIGLLTQRLTRFSLFFKHSLFYPFARINTILRVQLGCTFLRDIRRMGLDQVCQSDRENGVPDPTQSKDSGFGSDYIGFKRLCYWYMFS